MLASRELEAMKLTVALVGLREFGDTKHFLELNSSAAAVDQMRDSTSLPTGNLCVDILLKLKLNLKLYIVIIIWQVCLCTLNLYPELGFLC